MNELAANELVGQRPTRVLKGRSRRIGESLIACLAATGLLTGLGTAVVLTAGGGAASAATLATVGSAPLIPIGSQRLGAPDASSSLRFAVVLRPRSAASLESYAARVSEPGSPIFHHFLARGEFRFRFGPSSVAIANVEQALRRDGLHLGSVTPDGLILLVSGSIGRIESAFHTRIETYRLPSGRIASANMSALKIPAAIASSVQAVVGLSDLALPQSGASPGRRLFTIATTGRRSPRARETGGPKACSTASSYAAAYSAHTPAQLATAYSLNSLYAKGDLGKGVTVALFELESYGASDVAAYQTCFGTHTSISNVKVAGGPPPGYGSGEAALDIEDVVGIAPEAKILVYEAPNTTWTDVLENYDKIAADDAAQVVSSSWGECEAFLPSGEAASENTILEQMAVQGQTFFGITGDEGSTGCIQNGFATVNVSFNGSPDPTGLAVDPATETLYTTLRATGKVEVVNAVNGGFLSTVTVGSGPTAIAVDGTHDEAYVADQSGGAVSQFSTAGCNATKVSGCAGPAKTIKVGKAPTALAIDPATGTVYVANEGSGTISVIGETTNRVVATITVAGAPTGIALDATDNRIFFSNHSADTISEISGATCDAISQSGCTKKPAVASTGSSPIGVAYDPANGDVYVADNDSPGTLSVFLGATLKAVTTVTVGQYPVAVTASPSGKQILVAGKANASYAGYGAVSVVDAATNKLTTYLAAGSSPSSVVSDPGTDVVWSVDPSPGYEELIYIPLFQNVWDPGTQPFATSIGGTELTTVSPKPAETAWNEALNSLTGVPEGAGGGGISQVWKMPSWQNGPGVVNVYSVKSLCGASAGYCRELPDVSAAADWMHGYIIFYEGGWGGYGGTSAAAPFWAAMTALIEAQESTPHRLGLLAPDLYKLSAEGRHDFNDVTTGNNDYSTADNGDFPATAHYDLATGIGSPIGSGLAADLPAAFLPTISPGSLGAAKVGKHYSVQFSQTGAVGTIVWKLVGTLPSGVTFSKTGLLSGTPKSTGTWHFTISVHGSGVLAATAEQACKLVVTT